MLSGKMGLRVKPEGDKLQCRYEIPAFAGMTGKSPVD